MRLCFQAKELSAERAFINRVVEQGTGHLDECPQIRFGCLIDSDGLRIDEHQILVRVIYWHCDPPCTPILLEPRLNELEKAYGKHLSNHNDDLEGPFRFEVVALDPAVPVPQPGRE